jgi:predicted phosphodiesterase
MDVYTPQTIIVPSLDAPVPLHATGDWHIGEGGCAESTLRRAVERAAKDPRAIVLLLGDLGSFIAPDDKRWEPAAIAEGLTIPDLADWGGVLVERIAKIAEPIRNRVIGAVEGNHEAVFSRRNNWDVHRALCSKVGCRALGYSALFTLRFEEKGKPKHSRELRVFATHGAGGAATAGGKLRRLERHMESVDAALVLVGHMHAQLELTRTTLAEGDARIDQRRQVGVICGTYLRGYSQGVSGYSERKGYPPTDLGHARIVIVPETGDLSVGWVR